MTPEQARAWNAAIEAAVREYHNGIGAIMALKARYAVTVEHVGHSTKQEVIDLGETKNDG